MKKEFADYNNGVQVSKEVVNDWHNDIFEYLNTAPSGAFNFRMSGNSAVIGYKHDDEIVMFEITNGFKHFEYDL